MQGKWRAPLIANPGYQGKWTPQLIANPAYFEVPSYTSPSVEPMCFNLNLMMLKAKEPAKMLLPIGAIGLELWTMSEGMAFDNFLITSDEAEADQWAAATWKPKQVRLGSMMWTK